MLADQFPSVIVGGVDFPIRGIQEGNVVLEPIKVAIVPEVLGLEKLSLVENRSASGGKEGSEESWKQGKEQARHLPRLIRGKAAINPNLRPEL